MKPSETREIFKRIKSLEDTKPVKAIVDDKSEKKIKELRGDIKDLTARVDAIEAALKPKETKPTK